MNTYGRIIGGLGLLLIMIGVFMPTTCLQYRACNPFDDGLFDAARFDSPSGLGFAENAYGILLLAYLIPAFVMTFYGKHHAVEINSFIISLTLISLFTSTVIALDDIPSGRLSAVWFLFLLGIVLLAISLYFKENQPESASVIANTQWIRGLLITSLMLLLIGMLLPLICQEDAVCRIAKEGALLKSHVLDEGFRGAFSENEGSVFLLIVVAAGFIASYRLDSPTLWVVGLATLSVTITLFLGFRDVARLSDDHHLQPGWILFSVATGCVFAAAALRSRTQSSD